MMDFGIFKSHSQIMTVLVQVEQSLVQMTSHLLSKGIIISQLSHSLILLGLQQFIQAWAITYLYFKILMGQILLQEQSI